MHLEQTTSVIVTLLALIVSTVAQATDPPETEIVRISLTRNDACNRYSKIKLVCSTNIEEEDFTYWRRLDGQVNQVVSSESTGPALSFEMEPFLEGVYFCKNRNQTSINELELVAHPLQNRTVRKTYNRVTVPVGSSATLRCVYTPGALRERYRVEWFRGLRLIVSSSETTSPSSRYQILASDFSLVINDTTVNDANKGFYCIVYVENREGEEEYRLQGPNVELEVTGQLRVVQNITDKVSRVDQSVTFTCSVSSVPAASVRWLYQGVEVNRLPSDLGERFEVQPREVDTLSVVTVESSLTIRGLRESDTGGVQCLMLHTILGEMMVTSSAANLIVLPTTFAVTLLALQGGSAKINADLPARIPGAFSLVVRYIHDSRTAVDAELFDISFVNTQNIEYVIPKDRLPSFTSFSIRLAIKVSGIQGEFTEESNAITLNVETTPPTTSSPTNPPSINSPTTNSPENPSSDAVSTQDCQCNDSEDSTSAQTILLVFFIIVVFILLIIGIAITIFCIFYFSRNAKTTRSESGFNEYENVDYPDTKRSVSIGSGRRSSISSNSASEGSSDEGSDREDDRDSERHSVGEDSVRSDNLALATLQESTNKREEFPISEMNEDDVYQMTLPRTQKTQPRQDSVDPDVRSQDFTTQVPSYHDT